MKLNLGCGKNIKDPKEWVNADCIKTDESVIIMDMDSEWPFKDDTFEGVVASHSFEHGKEKLHIVEELWRVCKAGAKIHVIVPHPENPFFWQDPTHKLCWHVDNFDYFTPHYNWNYMSEARFKVLKKEIKCFEITCSENGKPQTIEWRLEVIK